jgi:hypothetical protein
VLCQPRIAVVPERVRTAGPQIVRIAAEAGIRLDETQAMVVDAFGGIGSDGRWSAYEVSVYCARQNQKTQLAIARLLFGLFVAREDYQVYSSHMVPSATKMFQRLARAVDQNRRLGGRIARVSNRRGSESIQLTTGQVVECVARSANSGRGFTGSTLIFDEAHGLDPEMLGAMLPMLSTVPNPQVWYLSSFADEGSLHIAGVRSRALAGQPGVAWVEWSIGPDEDLADREVWRRCNPAVGEGRISMAFLESEFRAMGPEVFAREHLGKSDWPTGAPGEWGAISKDAWEACLAPEAPAGVGVPVLAAESESVAGSEISPVWESWPDGIPPWLVPGRVSAF